MRILKLFKKHVLALFAAIVLIVISCNADLALPTYMSDIVDVGVQQGGIASPVPDTIRAESLDDLELFMSAKDAKAVEAYQALVYQLAKDIGAMAAVLHFDVDAIVYTAGMAYEDFFCDDITAYVGKIAPIIRLPGEEEMRSLAEGALRVLRGEQEAAQY